MVYSIDEVFMDVTDYLNTYKLSAHDLARKIILDVIETTGITATAGIGTNLFLCKVAMDIVAKHIPADETGYAIAQLDEMTYRQTMWSASTSHRLLAGRPWLCKEAGRAWDVYHGRRGADVRAQRGPAVSALWKKCGAAH